jgi:hypothetical protein
VVYASETSVEHAWPFCRKAANGFEGAFEALTNQATGFAGGIVVSNPGLSLSDWF